MKHQFQRSSSSDLTESPNPETTDSSRSRATPADDHGKIWEFLCPEPGAPLGRVWFPNILQAAQAGIAHWLATAPKDTRDVTAHQVRRKPEVFQPMTPYNLNREGWIQVSLLDFFFFKCTLKKRKKKNPTSSNF